MEAFNFSRLMNFVFEKPQERYPKLVRIFYVNLSYKDSIINSKVEKHPITMSLEYFAQVCNPPFMEEDYDQLDLEGNEYNFEIHVHSLLIDPSSRIPTPFNIGLTRPNTRLINYTMNQILFPRKVNYSTLKKLDVLVVWFLENQIVKTGHMPYFTTC